MGNPMSQVCAWTWKHSNLLSGISSRPLSFEAMIATCTPTDHDLLVRDLDEGQEVLVGLSILKMNRGGVHPEEL